MKELKKKPAPVEFIIIDLDHLHFVGEKGFVSKREFAKKFLEKDVHKQLAKLRRDQFLNVTFERIEVAKEDTSKERHIERVKNAVKQELEGKKQIVEMAQIANSIGI